MKKLIVLLLIVFPIIIQAQGDTVLVAETQIPLFHTGDTIINFNSLNNGIQKFQVSDDDKASLTANGLEIVGNGIVLVKDPSKMKQHFTFEVKTFATDNEWYINNVKVKQTGNNSLINITSDKIEMATGLRKDGKIYVVIAVATILFFVIIGYLIFLERKVKRLEKLVS